MKDVQDLKYMNYIFVAMQKAGNLFPAHAGLVRICFFALFFHTPAPGVATARHSG
jgi:hypothetical protein